LDDIDPPHTNKNYDYLLSMPIWSLTKERVEQVENQLGKKHTELSLLEKQSIEDLWNADLEKFKQEWQPGRSPDEKPPRQMMVKQIAAPKAI